MTSGTAEIMYFSRYNELFYDRNYESPCIPIRFFDNLATDIMATVFMFTVYDMNKNSVCLEDRGSS